MDRFVSNAGTQHLQTAFYRLDRGVIERRRAELVGVASNPSNPLEQRLVAAHAVGRVDRAEAVTALMTGYDSLDESTRLHIASMLPAETPRGEAGSTDTDAARAALERIAESDPSEKIRAMARRHLGVGE